MNRITQRFQQLREKKQAAFIPFITGGDPNLAMSEDIAVALGENGADVIEYGAPFSDPVGDGTVIQEASLRALQQGVNLRGILKSIERIRTRTRTPLLIFTYYNPVFVYGIEAFARDAANAGADGVLCVDLPPDYALEYRDVMGANDMTTVFLAAPTSTDERLALIGDACDTFVYYISRLGVTGEQVSLSQDLRTAVNHVREKTGKPVAVGFGISTAEQARQVADIAEGVVVGSAIVRIIADAKGAADTPQRVAAFSAELARAVKKV
ncbi:MAG: tryptophan synthase subunit alpha [Candidatus Hydrogenedentes bacterium]|nr:tryptophan synthase subunit alpha [Candidatus Hydrogenedentota bacterium]